MASRTNIPWTDRTFNPWIGCTRESPACDHCYAADLSGRFFEQGDGPLWGAQARRRFMPERYWRAPRNWNRAAEKAGVRQRVFCGSMCDVFEQLPAGHPDRHLMGLTRLQLFEVIEATPWLDWLLLTKRPQNVPAVLVDRPFQNVWLGVTAEDPERAKERIDQLLKLPAAGWFVSCEPLLAPIELQPWLPGVHRIDCDMDDDCTCGARHPSEALSWVIVGGESGRHARPLDVRNVFWMRDICRAAEVPFFFKGWGHWLPSSQARQATASGSMFWTPEKHQGVRKVHGDTYYAVGKKRSDNWLGGRKHEEFPREMRT